jgi:hypothetical protein
MEKKFMTNSFMSCDPHQIGGECVTHGTQEIGMQTVGGDTEGKMPFGITPFSKVLPEKLRTS